MKFSVLLPTRNRLELLSHAVETVLRQDYEDWEIIISDNCSEQNIEEYVKSLRDDRVKYYRTEGYVPVTENWNNALYRSSGDYVIMLGDDDCLMKGYFQIVDGLAKRFNDPDFIYSRVFLYAYPGVMPNYPDGLLQTNGCAEFFDEKTEPFLLEIKKARALVRQSMNFKLSFDYNMQYSIVSRKAINSLPKGTFFQSPYPDYYASNLLFLKAERIVICPMPLVTIGVSPKSFGAYYFNDKEEQGVEFLLPGPNMNTSWLLAMEALKVNYGPDIRSRVNYRRYRALQMVGLYDNCRSTGTACNDSLAGVWKQLTEWERFSFKIRLSILSVLERSFHALHCVRLLRAMLGFSSPYPENAPPRCSRRYNNILEVFEQVEPKQGLDHACKR
jgi:glycosyltransferase involved in cell wall biosynthesis